GEVDLAQRKAEAHHVRMRVDQAGQYRASAAVDALRPARILRQRLAAADRDDPAVVDAHRLEPQQPPVAVQRVAVDVIEEQLRRGGGPCAGRDDEREQWTISNRHDAKSPRRIAERISAWPPMRVIPCLTPVKAAPRPARQTAGMDERHFHRASAADRSWHDAMRALPALLAAAPNRSMIF